MWLWVSTFLYTENEEIFLMPLQFNLIKSSSRAGAEQVYFG